MVSDFLQSRRQGLSTGTILFYQSCLSKAIGTELTPQAINNFLSSLKCNNGKYSYYRCIRALCNWLIKNELIKNNPISKIEAPKPAKRILPSLTNEQVAFLIDHAESLRDKAIISLFSDSGMRLNELTNVKASDIDWTKYTITIIGKGNKQRKAPKVKIRIYGAGTKLYQYIFIFPLSSFLSGYFLVKTPTTPCLISSLVCYQV